MDSVALLEVLRLHDKKLKTAIEGLVSRWIGWGP